MNFSLAAAPTAVDLDADGLVDRVYAGDVGGQLWKFDVSAPATLTAGLVDNWAGKRLFAADPSQENPPPSGSYQPSQAIYGAPAVARDDEGSLWVFFGTGDLNRPVSASANRFYGLRDDTGMANGSLLTAGSLVDVTTTDAAGGNGWYIRLGADEKVFSGADVFDGTVYFTPFEPEPAATCDSAGGPARLYAVEITSGYAAIDWATGEKREPTSSAATRSTDAGNGIPSEPSVVTQDTGGILEAAIVTGTTAEQIASSSVPSVGLREVIYWREVF
jgi:type IV pilus assembly protein PilY1